MQFPNPIVNQLVIYGSADNLPDVRIGPDPQIVFYNGTAVFLGIGIFPPNTYAQIIFLDTVAGVPDEFLIEKSLGTAFATVRYFQNAAGGGEAAVRLSPTYLNLRMSPGGSTTVIDVVLRDTLTAGIAEIFVDKPVVMQDPNVGAAQTSEIWHNAVLQNAWTSVGVAPFNAVSYRLMPDNTVRLRGVATGGAIGAGTIVFNLPGAYRPANRKQFPITLNAGTTLTAVCQVIEVGGAGAGNVTIYGVPAANAIVFDEISFMLPVV
jgi:hypothetical protein